MIRTTHTVEILFPADYEPSQVDICRYFAYTSIDRFVDLLHPSEDAAHVLQTLVREDTFLLS